MTAGLILHLSGIQHWGGPQGGKVRDTHPHPTRSALTGMLAAALGRPRGSDLRDLDQLGHTIRIDRPGRRLPDFHTVGGGYPKARTVMTADGTRRGEALVFEDWYLHDAAFTIALTGPPDLLDQTEAALQHPVFPPHLGRRSCPPDMPVLITRTDNTDATLSTLPLHRTAPHHGDHVDVAFLSEHAPTDQPQLPHTRRLQDAPLPGRNWTSRKLWETRRRLPAGLCKGLGTDYLQALTAYRTAL
ncbi:type I-E CRISPR-associated protein Cas5/CasD [Streptomyces xanthochromogenes]|uniref:Type I-E CRISPR-associated protein Cas5/CasD n=1 Tax=Streptomyces xanthochromogenes TaxID=67384 RepID=A0ABQ2ZH85_9ACTN|nr:type I-E CRISPR-associated protein Cas5/CasD [Streptomyces xanthochromogenes]GGY13220.1 hypothetical protein GCM10010326_00540 [Streptomyces xanthochromogenes]